MRRAVASLLLVALTCTAAHADDLGRIGPSWPIGEPHLLRFIEQRLREKERSGELARLEQQAKARAVASVTSPAPVPGLSASGSARTFYFDPSFTLERSIVDERGHVLFAAGTRANPLEVVSLSRRLLFFDARDPRQVAHARGLIDAHRGRVKPILVGGSYLELMRSWRVAVYYDQHGTLTRRLGIAQVPAVVSQEGLRLRIDELVVQ